MNWAQVETNWKQMKSHVRRKWGKFTESELDVIAGNKDVLSGQLQEKYGFAKHLADKELDRFALNLRDDIAATKPGAKAGA